jgi:hypothetical protein
MSNDLESSDVTDDDNKNPRYARVDWSATDVLDRHYCTRQQAEAWLARHEKHLQEAMIRAGWAFIAEFCPFDQRPEDLWGDPFLRSATATHVPTRSSIETIRAFPLPMASDHAEPPARSVEKC